MQKTDVDFKKLPDAPGVYFFKLRDEILYIGKATSLRDRVRSYFGKDLVKTRGMRIIDMVTLSDSIEVKQSESVLEALLLESTLIKKNQPKYNIKEKDNKSFNYVVITKEDWPRVFVVRKREVDFKKGKYAKMYGPFVSRKQIEEGLKIIRKIFPFRREKTSHERFYQQLDLLPENKNSDALERYKQNLRHIQLFFAGKKKIIEVELERQMKKFAKELKFEEAQIVKRKIFALNHIRDVSLLTYEETVKEEATKEFRIEAYDIAHLSGTNTVGVMTVVESGEAVKSEYRKFKIRTKTGGDDLKATREMLTRRLKHLEWRKPDMFVVDGGETQRNVFLDTLAQSPYKNIPVVNVVKNKQHKAEKFLGDTKLIERYRRDILLVNSEAHRFAITYHKNLREKIKEK